MLKNNIKTNIIEKITANNQNIICNTALASRINKSHITALLTRDINENENKLPLIYGGDIRSVSLQQLKNFECVSLLVKEYTKEEIMSFSNMLTGENIAVIYVVNNLLDIIKIRSLSPKVVVINQQPNQNILALKLYIDWNCSCLLSPLKNNVSMEYVVEYGFSGIYAENYINENICNIEESILSSGYLNKLYTKKSSIRPLLKASNISDDEELQSCIAQRVDIVGFVFDNIEKSNIISMLKLSKENNRVVCLEVYKKEMLLKAQELIKIGLADCIENHTEEYSYIANSYGIFSAFNKNINGITPMVVENISSIEDNNMINPWFSYTENQNISSIIKLHNIELIEFSVKKYNTQEKIKNIIKKIKYKQ